MLRRGAQVCVSLVATLLAAPQILAAHRHYVQWAGAANDPSAQDTYATFLEMELTLALGALLIAAVCVWLLGRSARNEHLD